MCVRNGFTNFLSQRIQQPESFRPRCKPCTAWCTGQATGLSNEVNNPNRRRHRPSGYEEIPVQSPRILLRKKWIEELASAGKLADGVLIDCQESSSLQYSHGKHESLSNHRERGKIFCTHNVQFLKKDETIPKTVTGKKCLATTL